MILTDAERAFAHSPRGIHDLAREQANHRMREAHRGDRAAPWTDAMQVDAIRRLSRDAARSTVATAALVDGEQAKLAQLQHDAAVAKMNRRDNLHNAWRRQG